MAAGEMHPCVRCGVTTLFPEPLPEVFECRLCLALGPRALVPILRAPAGERGPLVAAFRAAPPYRPPHSTWGGINQRAW